MHKQILKLGISVFCYYYGIFKKMKNMTCFSKICETTEKYKERKIHPINLTRANNFS